MLTAGCQVFFLLFLSSIFFTFFTLARLIPAFVKVFSETRGDFFGASPEVIRHGPVLRTTIWQLCHRSEVFTCAVIKGEFFDFVFHDLSILALAPKGKFYFSFLKRFSAISLASFSKSFEVGPIGNLPIDMRRS